MTTLTPSLSVSEEFTDNAGNAASGKQEEFITVVTPGLSLTQAEKTHDLRLTYRPGFTFYRRDSANDTIRHNADAAFTARLSRQTELTLSDSFSRTEEPRSNAEMETLSVQAPVDPTIRRGRQPYSTNAAAVSLNHRFGPSDSFGLGYTHHLLENDDPLLEDNHRHSPWASVSYWFTEHLGIDADLVYERGEFEAPTDDLDQYDGTLRMKHQLSKAFTWFVRYTHTVADYDGDTEDYTIYDPGVGFSWTVDKDTALNFDIGYFMQKGDGSADETGLSFNGDLGKTWRIKRGSLRLSGQSGYEETSYGAENLGLDIFYGLDGNASYALTKALSASANASYRRDKYINQATKRRDNVYDLTASMSYRPKTVRWLSLTLTYGYHDIDSSLDANDTTENRATVSISLFPVTPYRLD